MTLNRILQVGLSAAVIMATNTAHAINVDATAKALRLANTITGGLMPSSDPLFAQMVAKVAAGDVNGAAAIASGSKYFANYLARRLALQMQTPALDADAGSDNDATAFLIGHFVGGGGTPASLSTIWSDNATFTVNNGTAAVHAAALTPAQLSAVNWQTALTRVPGQIAKAQAPPATVTIPSKHVGGYVTLSDRINDNSFAMWAATAGTNLRFIEGIWEIATGLELMDVASTQATVQDVPRFVPEFDPNFFHGTGQPACIACHGGGMSSLNHGYATVADTFNFDPASGFTYIATPTTATRKSLGSDPTKRVENAACILAGIGATPNAVCNPDSVGVDANQSWNVGVTWGSQGVLQLMGWKGSTAGQGLNELGQAIGKASIVYENFTKRVINEVCPMGMFSPGDISQIAASANPYASPAGTDDIRTIVNKVAVHSSCL